MVTITVGTAVPWGYVRAVFSRRVGGHAVPLELVRAHLRGTAKMAQRRANYRRKYDAKGRVAAAFADYLVTDVDDEALRVLEALPVPAFSSRRGLYRPGMDSLFLTGAAMAPWHEVRSEMGGGPIDAPELFAAGGCMNLGLFWFYGDDAPQMIARRGAE